MSLEQSQPTKPRRRKSTAAQRDDLREDRSWTPVAAAPKSPSRTFKLPGGKRITLATDRVRAAPAVSPQVSFVLGQNAIGLGLWGLLAPKSVNRFLGLRNSAPSTQLLFGAREMATGMALFSDPTRASVLWARVAGDAFDIAVLSGLNRAQNPKRRNARLALGVVLAVTALDIITAVRMSTVKRNRP